MADFKYILEHNAVAAIHHADAMVDRGEITFGEYEEMIKPWTDAEPVKHGHWIFNPKDAIEMMFTLPKCSECGVESSDGGNYCPNCGARMNEEAEA